MAELASGAVSSLLRVIGNEARLLGGVRGDVQFIKEEMESMNSFLVHLARTAPPGGEHSEQERTWMNQVRILANDCNNCIDKYVYRGNPDVHLRRSGLRRYLLWAHWFLNKMVAQHQAAVQLRVLKERAREVGERRMRYDVKVPVPAVPEKEGASRPRLTTTEMEPAYAVVIGADEEDDLHADESAVESRRRAAILFKHSTLDDYFRGKLVQWIQQVKEKGDVMHSAAVMAPEADQEVIDLARGALAQEHRSVVVDIPQMHMDFEPLRPQDILYYILWQLQLDREMKDAEPQPQSSSPLSSSQSQQQDPTGESPDDPEEKEAEMQYLLYSSKREISRAKERLLGEAEIQWDIQNVMAKLDKVKRGIRDEQLKEGAQQQLRHLLDLLEQTENVKELEDKPIDVLLKLLVLLRQAAQRDQVRSKAMRKLEAWYAHILRMTAENLKKYIEKGGGGEGGGAGGGSEGGEEGAEGGGGGGGGEEDVEQLQEEGDKKDHQEEKTMTVAATKKLDFYDARYGYILHKAFATKASSNSTRHQDTVEGQIKGMISKVTEVIRELQDDPAGQIPVPQDVATEAEEKNDEIKKTVQEQREIGWIVRKITENHFKVDKRPLIVILRIGDKIYESNWDENRYAFTRLENHVDGVLIVTTTKSTQQAKESFRQQQLIESFRQGEPLDYSLAGLYHDIVLQLITSHPRNEDLSIGGEKDKNEDYSNPQIIRDILGECEQYEFCMKILAHSFYARPKRSNKELSKLRNSLRAVSPKSFEGVAIKMFKFSYNDLPKEYKSCLLYLAIFPLGRSIRRSTLVSRWVVEGLLSHGDWNAAVRQAERCFDALIDRGLVDPAEISGTGKVKRCAVGDRVHGFITTIAKKQHIVETRLSQHLAHHFSIFSDIRLRASEKIKDFLQVLPKQYHFSRLKVLDLEGCTCVGMKNKSYLKDVCCNLLLLKHLNLRSTNVRQLPREINHLHELEVLDICHNNVCKTATRDLRLLKLKRLLAGCIDDPTPRSVELPEKIGKMEGMEVLLGVMPRHWKDLDGIAGLCLRKIGVVINKDRYLQPLLQAINDLHENLRSLSITLEATLPEGNSQQQLPAHNGSSLERMLDQLETLSLSGTTQMGQLLPLLTEKSNQLTKVTLSSTRLNQDDLKVLAQLPRLHYLKLRHKAYNDSELTFKKDEFKYLKCFLVEGSNMNHIIFDHGATPELEQMLLPFTGDLKLSGVENLEKLEELELRNNNSNTTSSSSSNATAASSSSTATTTTKNNNTTSSSNTAIASSSRTTTTSTPVTTDATAVAAADTDTTTIDNKNMPCSLLEKGKLITKVTLRGITLRQDDLRILGKNQTIHCLVLLDMSDDQMELTFNENEFQKLNLLIVECSGKIKLSFTARSCPKLEKFVTNVKSLSGIDNLPGLKELEFKVKDDFVPKEVKLAVNKLKDRLHFTHYKSEN